MGRRQLNLIGRKFGYLTAQEPVRDEKGKVKWKCSCVCGKTVYVRTALLTNGRIRSCGCKQHKRAVPRRYKDRLREYKGE